MGGVPSFPALFIGPSVFALSWRKVLRKLVRFCRAHNVTSVPDLLCVRYGGTPSCSTRLKRTPPPA